MFGLGQAFEMIRAEGLDNIFRRHRLLAEAVRRAVAVWARGKAIEFNITAPAERSDTVTTVLMADGQDARPLRDYCNTKCGVVLGQGLGDMTGKAFRIAHMGHINAPMVLGTLGVVECALEALRIPHRKGGVQAAIDWLGAQVKA
jgi:alanine-glyoxylate transaminase/serine-glyoxylate transaminase/serine-pyruvate transaminase